MCTSADFNKTEITEHDITAFKVVLLTKVEGEFTSQYIPRRRTFQEGWETRGRVKKYREGKNYRSSLNKTPGLYCFASFPSFTCTDLEAVLEVCIPAGTKIVKGYYGYSDTKTINAERITSVKRCSLQRDLHD